MYSSRKASRARLREAQNARDNRAEIVKALSFWRPVLTTERTAAKRWAPRITKFAVERRSHLEGREQECHRWTLTSNALSSRE